MSAGAIFITLVIAMFPALILVALVVKLWEIHEASRWPETTGKVIASRVQSRRNRPDDQAYNFKDTEVSNEPFVEYEYKVGGRKYRCSRITIGEKISGSELKETLDRYPVGKSVTVYYHPGNPARALLERTLPTKPMIVGGGALLLFFVGGPLLAAFLYFNLLGWLKSQMANPGRASATAVVTGLGIAATWFTVVFNKMVRDASRWPVTRGRIVASDVEGFRDWRNTDSHNRSGMRFKPGVTYAYEVNGREYLGDRLTMGVVVSSSIPGLSGRTAARYPVGSEVTVHYNPLSPGESVLNPHSALHQILWLIAAALFLLAWAMATGRIR